MDRNLEYIRSGKTGCVFATIMARNPDKIGWKRVINPVSLDIPENAYIVSYVFEDKTMSEVRQWALSHGMYIEKTSSNTEGLRINTSQGVSWVQYFGPDAHVKTRQAPQPELLFCVKLPRKRYHRVGFKGVLHLAHASVSHIKDKALDYIWNSSFEKTRKILGHKPTVVEAAKTTYINER